MGNQGITWIFELITELLTSFIRINTQYKSEDTDSKIIDIANCTTWKKSLLDAEDVISISYYYETPKTGASYESTDGPTEQLADNPLNSGRLGNFHRIIPELMV